jgi:hemerythrin-like metal-binding protein
MILFTWDDKYSVKNEDFDNHHKVLIDIFNRMYGHHLCKGDSSYLDPIIEELVSYSLYHFLLEEQHMRDIGYKEVDSHINDHRGFTLGAIQLRKDVKNDDREATKDLIEFLGKWLLNHIVIEDKKYSIQSSWRF